jgi:hypothetical protein
VVRPGRSIGRRLIGWPGLLGSPGLLGMSAWRGMGAVHVTGRAGPGEHPVFVLANRPSGLVLEPVVMPAQRGQVARTGRSIRIAPGVVEVASDGGAAAAGEPACDVAGPNVVGQCGRRHICGAAELEECAATRIGEQPTPDPTGGEHAGQVSRDRTVSRQLAGRIGDAEQRGGRNRDLDECAWRSGASSCGVARTRHSPGHQRHERVGAPRVDTESAISPSAAGIPVEGGVDRDGLVGRE